MSGEKTEKPTQKRLRDARKKGQVSKSQDLSSSLMLITNVAIFWLGGAAAVSVMIKLMHDGIEQAGSFKGILSREAAFSSLLQAAQNLAIVLSPWFISLFLGAILFNYIQVGSIFSFESIKPDFNKLNPAEGFKQKFLKSRPYIELVKTLIKAIITFAVVAVVIYQEISNIVALIDYSVANVGKYTFLLVLRIGFYVGISFTGVGIGDFFLQRLLFINQMKMSKQEVKQEYKESEGDPHVKHQRRRLHREILSQTSAKAVQKADVVVVNPTHLAVAVKYDRENMSAPSVVAKGAELIAGQIREIAKEADVPILRDVALARALYEIEVDTEIPEELYETVAEVLRWVYSLNEEL